MTERKNKVSLLKKALNIFLKRYKFKTTEGRMFGNTFIIL